MGSCIDYSWWVVFETGSIHHILLVVLAQSVDRGEKQPVRSTTVQTENKKQQQRMSSLALKRVSETLFGETERQSRHRFYLFIYFLYNYW